MAFEEISVKALGDNPFSLIGDKWMLITAGQQGNLNTMTASWGGLGVLWNKNVAFSFVRPQRHTFSFLEREDYYTLSFYQESYRPALAMCGKVSGKDTDKISKAGLTPVFDEPAPYFSEARLVLVCKKIYGQFLQPTCFIDEKIEECYPEKDYHKMYVGEVVNALVCK